MGPYSRGLSGVGFYSFTPYITSLCHHSHAFHHLFAFRHLAHSWIPPPFHKVHLVILMNIQNSGFDSIRFDSIFSNTNLTLIRFESFSSNTKDALIRFDSTFIRLLFNFNRVKTNKTRIESASYSTVVESITFNIRFEKIESNTNKGHIRFDSAVEKVHLYSPLAPLNSYLFGGKHVQRYLLNCCFNNWQLWKPLLSTDNVSSLAHVMYDLVAEAETVLWHCVLVGMFLQISRVYNATCLIDVLSIK
jgi:hypothetical protein